MYSTVVYFIPGQTILFKTGDLTDHTLQQGQLSIHWGVPNVDPTDEVMFFKLGNRDPIIN